ncbi:MAG: CopD family protein [Vicinamibacterales bacterium]
MWDAFTPETGAKGVVYLATLAYAGAVTAVALARGAAGPLAAVATRVARVAALAGLGALVLRLVLHASVVAGGVPDAETLRLVTLESRWGGRWQWQAAAAAAAVAVALTRGLSRGVWLPPAFVAAAWCVATPLLGHGASSVWQQATHAAHLAVAGAWLGTVGVLALAARDTPPAVLGAAIRRFSPVALACAAGAGVSGVVLALTYLGTIDAAVSSPYGRWLLAKLAAVAAVGACGLVNWRRTRAGAAPAPAVLRAEALAAVLVVVVTAIVTETEHPAP